MKKMITAGSRQKLIDFVQGCCKGDQSGSELSVVPAYMPSCGWDYILVQPPDINTQIPLVDNQNPEIVNPLYRVKTRRGWLPYMQGPSCQAGSGDDFAGVIGQPIYGLDIDWKNAAGWFQVRTKNAPNGLPINCTGDNSKVIGITIYYQTQSPAQTGWYRAKYRVSPLNKDFYKWKYDDKDCYAGDLRSPIDRIQLALEIV